MLLFMISLAGIPPTAGFIGKFYLFMAAVNAGLTWLAVVGLIFAAVSAFYYLRIVMVMYMREPSPDQEGETRLALSPTATVVLGPCRRGRRDLRDLSMAPRLLHRLRLATLRIKFSHNPLFRIHTRAIISRHGMVPAGVAAPRSRNPSKRESGNRHPPGGHARAPMVLIPSAETKGPRRAGPKPRKLGLCSRAISWRLPKTLSTKFFVAFRL